LILFAIAIGANAAKVALFGLTFYIRGDSVATFTRAVLSARSREKQTQDHPGYAESKGVTSLRRLPIPTSCIPLALRFPLLSLQAETWGLRESPGS